MKRIRIVGLCLGALCAMLAVAATSAFATPPAPEYGKCHKLAVAGGEGFSDAGCTKHVASAAKYVWEGGAATGITFSTQIKELTKATLETVKKEKVICNGETSTGKVLNSTEIETTPTFTECQALTKACSTPGAKEGEIQVAALQGALGIEKVGWNTEKAVEEPSKSKLASSLARQSNPGGEIVEFSCSGFIIKVKGTVLFPVTTNKMVTTATVKFAQSGGKQKPERFELEHGVKGPIITLESKFGEGSFERSGQAITTIQKNSAAFEASAVN